MLGVLVFDTLPGLVIGIVVSLLLLLYRASKPHVAELGRVPGGVDQYADRDRHPENDVDPGVAVLRVESGLFFANADAVRTAIKAHAAAPGTRGVVLDAETVAFVDVTAVRMLDELADDLARDRTAARHRPRPRPGRRPARRPPARPNLQVFPTIDEAIASAQPTRPTRPRIRFRRATCTESGASGSARWVAFAAYAATVTGRRHHVTYRHPSVGDDGGVVETWPSTSTPWRLSSPYTTASLRRHG